MAKKFSILAIGFVLLASGCAVTRGVSTPQSDLDELRGAVERGPTPEQELGPHVKAGPSIMEHYLHASGRVRCSGFIRKKQTAFVHAWLTAPGPGGELSDVPVINLKFDYLDGLFAGARVEGEERFAEEFSLHETITGVGDICSCIYAVADATLLNTTRLQVKEKICPE